MTTNEAAERLRGGLEAIRDTSTDSASRQLADSLLALLAVHDGRVTALEERLRDLWECWDTGQDDDVLDVHFQAARALVPSQRGER